MFCYWYGWMIFAHGCLLRFNSYYPSQLTCFCGICQYFKKNTKVRAMKNTAGNLQIAPYPIVDRAFGDIHISTVPQSNL